MTTPDPMDEIFAEYTGGVTAAADASGADRLWRKAKRRRVSRVAVAGVAALALTGTATWALQQTATAEEEGPAPAAASETPADEHAAEEEAAADRDWYADEEEYLDSLGPIADLIGAELDLPSFVPGDADVDAVCGADGAVLGDGTHEEPVEPGSVSVKKAVAGTLAGDGGGWAEVGLFGCRYGEETLYQAVVLEETGDGTWAAGEQIVHSVPGGESPQYLTATQDKGVLIGFAERYDPAANDLAFNLESVGFDAAGEPVREEVAELDDGAGCSDLSMRFEVTETGEAGVWDVTLEVRNHGPRDIADHELRVFFDETITVLSGEPLDTPDWGPWTTFEIDELGVGEVYAQEWTIAVGEDPDRVIPASLNADYKAVAPWEERGEFARTVLWGQGGTQYYFWE